MSTEEQALSAEQERAYKSVATFAINFFEAQEKGGVLHAFMVERATRANQRTQNAVSELKGEQTVNAPDEKDDEIIGKLNEVLGWYRRNPERKDLCVGSSIFRVSRQVPKESMFYADTQCLLGIYWYSEQNYSVAALHFLNAFTAEKPSLFVKQVQNWARENFFQLIDGKGSLSKLEKDVLLITAALRGDPKAEDRVKHLVQINEADGKRALTFQPEINSYRRYKILQGLRVLFDYSKSQEYWNDPVPYVQGNQYSNEQYLTELYKFRGELELDAGRYAEDPYRFKVLDKVNREILLYDKSLHNEVAIRKFYNEEKNCFDQREVKAPKLTNLKKKMLSEDWGVRYYKKMGEEMSSSASIMVFLVTIPFWLAYYAIRATFVFGIYAAYKGLTEKKPEEKIIPKDKGEVISDDAAPLLSQEPESHQKDTVTTKTINTNATEIETRVTERKQAGSNRYISDRNSFWFATGAESKAVPAQVSSLGTAAVATLGTRG